MPTKTDTLIDESAAPAFITQRDVAALFGVSISTIFNWRSRGILNGTKVGGTIFFKRTDVLALMNNPGTQ